MTGYTAAEPAPDRRTRPASSYCTDKDKHCPDKTETAPPTAGSYPPAIFSDDAKSLTSHSASDENPLTDPVLTGARSGSRYTLPLPSSARNTAHPNAADVNGAPQNWPAPGAVYLNRTRAECSPVNAPRRNPGHSQDALKTA